MPNILEYQKNLENLKSIVKNRASIVAISKYASIEEIKAFIKLGLKDFGENRIDVLLDKDRALKDLEEDVSWHFIGKIQSNKINKIFELENIEYIHSVDSLKLLEKMLLKKNKIKSLNGIKYFLQVNTSKEKEKSGFVDFEELLHAYRFALKESSQEFMPIGLMTMGKIRTENLKDSAIESFSILKDYKEGLEVQLKYELKGEKIKLSMGMSQDFELALMYGADFIRPGRFLFKS